MKKKLLNVLAGIVIAASFAGAAVGCTKEGPTEVIVGIGNTYQPYCYLDADNNLAGYDYELLKEVDDRLEQYTFKFEQLAFATIAVSLQAGQIDIGAHQYEENDDRRATFLFGEEGYNTYNSYLVVPSQSAVTDIDTLAGSGVKLLTSTGGNQDAFIKNYNAAHTVKIETVERPADSALLVGLLTDGSHAMFFTKGDYSTLIAALTPYGAAGAVKILGGDTPVIVSKAYFLFNKTNSTLQEAVDGALREIKADGTLNEIRDRIVGGYYGDGYEAFNE
jgi:L-cystine transport system substrate-binding protein